MKIEDYVRTKYGIAKIEEIKPDDKHKTIWYTVDKAQYHCFLVQPKDIIKSSPNIIDLIEAGDYVNGKLVIEHAYQKGRLFVTNLYIGGKGFTTCEDYSWELTKEDEDRIETIVTKEQFESMKYKVVE